MKINMSNLLNSCSYNKMRIAILTLFLFTLLPLSSCNIKPQNKFDGSLALQNIEYQLSLGPRLIGSQAHEDFIDWATTELTRVGWEVNQQKFDWAGHQLVNIIATKYTGQPWIILGAHYDSRFIADQDPDLDKRALPVPGANDGASGVAVLLEIARVLPTNLDKNIWIVLFDAEDNGDIPGWEWILGSRAFASNLIAPPSSVIIVDMVGDADLNVYVERNSSPDLVDEIWGIAGEMHYSQFIPETKYQILDDHIPFLQAGIPAVDIIDFDYPYWHTSQDTLDKISAESLDAIGEVLLAWLLR